MGEQTIPDAAVHDALDRVLASTEFEGSSRLQAFLRDFYPELPRFIPGGAGG